MKLSAPTQVVFIVSLVLGVLGLLSGFGIIGALGGNAYNLMAAAWVVMTAGVVLKGI